MTTLPLQIGIELVWNLAKNGDEDGDRVGQSDLERGWIVIVQAGNKI